MLTRVSCIVAALAVRPAVAVISIADLGLFDDQFIDLGNHRVAEAFSEVLHHHRRVERPLVAEGSPTEEVLVSRPREFHPRPLAEPYVTLSRHTAPIIQPLPVQVVASV